MRQLTILQEAALKDMVFNATGLQVKNIVRTFMASRSFRAALLNNSGNIFYYGQVDISLPGAHTSGDQLAFKLKDELVRMTGAPGTALQVESDMAILFDRLVWVGANISGDFVFGSIAGVDFVPVANEFNLDIINLGGDNALIWTEPDKVFVDGQEAVRAIGESYPVDAIDKWMLFRDNTPGSYLLFNEAKTFVEWGRIDPLNPHDLSIITVVGGSLKVGTLGWNPKVFPFTYFSSDGSFAIEQDGIWWNEFDFNIQVPDGFGLMLLRTYKIKTNKAAGKVRIRSYLVATGAITADYPDTLMDLADGFISVTINEPMDDAAAAVPGSVGFRLDYTAPVVAAVGNILVKNQDAAKTFYWLHNGVSGNLAPGAEAVIAITAGVAFFTKYVTPPTVSGGDSSSRKKWNTVVLYQSYYTTGTEIFYDFIGWNRLSYNKDGVFTTWS